MRTDKVWIDEATRLAMVSGGGGYRYETVWRGVKGYAAKLSPLLEASGNDWDASVDRAAWSRWGAPGPGDVPRADDLLGNATLLVRCLRIARLVATHAHHRLCDCDLAHAADVLGHDHLAREVALRASGSTSGDGAPPDTDARVTSFEASFLWKPARWREEGLAIGVTAVPVPVVSVSDAPVAANLLTRDGGRLAVRSTDVGFVRPVLAPGGWRPMDVASFARAVRTGEAWRDNPFLGGDVRGVLTSFAEVGSPERDPRPGGRDADRRSAAEAALVARTPSLRIVDGIVHRVTGTPGLDLRAHAVTTGEQDDPQGRNVYRMVRWRLEGDLCEFSPTDPFGHAHGTVRSHAAIAAGDDGWHPVGMAWHEALHGYARAYATQDGVVGTGQVAYGHAPVVTDVDAELLPGDGPTMSDARAGLETEAARYLCQTPGMGEALGAVRSSGLSDPSRLAALKRYHAASGYEQVRAVLAADEAVASAGTSKDEEAVLGFAP